jgi:hypothetical protein
MANLWCLSGSRFSILSSKAALSSSENGCAQVLRLPDVYLSHLQLPLRGHSYLGTGTCHARISGLPTCMQSLVRRHRGHSGVFFICGYGVAYPRTLSFCGIPGFPERIKLVGDTYQVPKLRTKVHIGSANCGCDHRRQSFRDVHRKRDWCPLIDRPR